MYDEVDEQEQVDQIKLLAKDLSFMGLRNLVVSLLATHIIQADCDLDINSIEEDACDMADRQRDSEWAE